MRCAQRTGIEPVLPEVPTTTPASVQILRVSAVHTLHHFGQDRHLVRHGNQVDVIGHQATGQNYDFGECGLFTRKVEVDEAIRSCAKSELARGSVLGDVVRHAGRNETSNPRRPDSGVPFGPAESQGKPKWDGSDGIRLSRW